jgi:hypothetical protein
MRSFFDRISQECLRDVLQLASTLFDIVRLQKGPDAIPHSQLLLAVIVTLWLAAGMLMMATAPELDGRDFVIGTIIGVVGLCCYAAVIVASGRSARLLQAMAAFLGCGALISLLFVASDALLTLLAGEQMAGVIATLILLWSLPVEGHIISRTIERHWYVGILIAVAVFVLQMMLYSVFDPQLKTTT